MDIVSRSAKYSQQTWIFQTTSKPSVTRPWITRGHFCTLVIILYLFLLYFLSLFLCMFCSTISCIWSIVTSFKDIFLFCHFTHHKNTILSYKIHTGLLPKGIEYENVHARMFILSLQVCKEGWSEIFRQGGGRTVAHEVPCYKFTFPSWGQI